MTEREARRLHWRRIIFEHDTREGRLYDLVLIVMILASVVAVVVDSLPGLSPRAEMVMRALEWGFTLAFTAEYAARLWCAEQPARYARSFFGIVDLLAVVPTYLSLVFPAGRFLALIRVLRVLRIFRVLKLTTYVQEAGVLMSALRASRQKITVFLFTVLTVVTVVGSLMFLIEGPEAGFTSIPVSMYWAIVTLTTVGYGDIAPMSVAGRFLASALMVLGYAIIAVPTGIVTLELQRANRQVLGVARCGACGLAAHDADARHCKRCGAKLDGVQEL